MSFSDAEFTEELRSYLDAKAGEPSPAVPIFYRANRKIDREKTLNLQVFDGMTPAKKADLLK